MRKVVIFGNSGAGKSTLARQIAADEDLAHLDLDTIAWEQGDPPQRTPLEDAGAAVDKFMEAHTGWVIEGCYADLIELVLPQSPEIIFLDLPVEDCIANARARPWEPHKYESKEDQDRNLEMLLGWVADYESRKDEFSLSEHQAIFRNFDGKKIELFSNAEAQNMARKALSATHARHFNQPTNLWK